MAENTTLMKQRKYAKVNVMKERSTDDVAEKKQYSLHSEQNEDKYLCTPVGYAWHINYYKCLDMYEGNIKKRINT